MDLTPKHWSLRKRSLVRAFAKAPAWAFLIAVCLLGLFQKQVFGPKTVTLPDGTEAATGVWSLRAGRLCLVLGLSVALGVFVSFWSHRGRMARHRRSQRPASSDQSEESR